MQHRYPANSHELCAEYFRSRSDIGFIKALLDVALDPRDPFKPWERRKLRKGFAATILLLLVSLVWFGYFSLPQ